MNDLMDEPTTLWKNERPNEISNVLPNKPVTQQMNKLMTLKPNDLRDELMT